MRSRSDRSSTTRARRRLLTTGAASLAALAGRPVAAQRLPRPVRVGYPSAGRFDEANVPEILAGRTGLGWIEGRDLVLKRRADFRHGAGYVARILRGGRPGDLPVERPTKFDLRVNARSAREPGLASPPALPVLADQVFE